MKTVAEVIGVSRSNLADRLQERCKKRIGRPPRPDDELVSKINADYVHPQQCGRHGAARPRQHGEIYGPDFALGVRSDTRLDTLRDRADKSLSGMLKKK